MENYKFNLTGTERKQLVGAISEILNQPLKYLGAPTFAYEVGTYHIDKNGTVTGEYNLTLLAALEDRGFEYEANTTNNNRQTDAVGESFETSDSPLEPEVRSDKDIDEVVIEIPLEGFTPECLENLTKMVNAKEPLIKKSLGAEDLPIEILEDRIAFPWFRLSKDNGAVDAYAKFITCLCTTAKEKKRVTAKAPDSFENEKFAMRVWLIGLGMIGKEYALARKLLLKNLDGNSSWRYGAPGKAAPIEAAQEADNALNTADPEVPVEVPAEETFPAKAALAAEEAPTEEDNKN